MTEIMGFVAEQSFSFLARVYVRVELVTIQAYSCLSADATLVWSKRRMG